MTAQHWDVLDLLHDKIVNEKPFKTEDEAILCSRRLVIKFGSPDRFVAIPARWKASL